MSHDRGGEDCEEDFPAMNMGLFTIVIAGFLCGCSSGSPDKATWFIDSYRDGVITVRHDGNTYEAKCESSKFYNTVDSKVVEASSFSACDIAIGLVGHKVQSFDVNGQDTKGVAMWVNGSNLALRSWASKAAWTQEQFKVISVAKISH
jgi:hypothetical protein